jgi:hypothetical protein
MALATSLPLTTGEYVRTGPVALGNFLRVNSSTRRFEGITPAAAAAEFAAIDAALTLVPDAAYSWDSTALNLAVTHAAAACDITLPSEAQITNWVPGSIPRRVFKMNTSVNGINLLSPATVTINGGAADANMSPIPDTNAAVSNTALGQWVYVYRQTATAFWVWGGQ